MLAFEAFEIDVLDLVPKRGNGGYESVKSIAWEVHVRGRWRRFRGCNDRPGRSRMVDPIRPELGASMPQPARRRSVAMTTHIGEEVQQVELTILFEGTHANSAKLKKEVIEVFPGGDERFFRGGPIVRKRDCATAKVGSNLSLPHGLYREAEGHRGGTAQFLDVVQYERGGGIVACGPFVDPRIEGVEGWLHYVVEKLPGQASMTPCCGVGGAILPAEGFRHGPASRGIGGGVAGFAS